MAKSKNDDRAVKMFYKAPYFILISFLIFCIQLILLLLIASLNEPLILLSFITSVIIGYVATNRMNFDTGSVLNAKLYILVHVLFACFLLGWLLFNARYTAENIHVNRDPGIYSVTGQWLIQNDNLAIHTNELGIESKKLTTNSLGFSNNLNDPNRVDAQGLHLLPALLGAVGKFSSEALMLKLPVLFGSLAILAVFVALREFVRAHWAATVSATFALSIPILYFSRDTYTEPLSVALIFTSLAFITNYLRSGKTNYQILFLIGLVSGSVLLARADGLLVGLSISAYLCARVLFAVSKDSASKLYESAVYFMGLAMVVFIAWLDVAKLSSVYYSNHGQDVLSQVYVLIAMNTATWLMYIVFHNRKSVQRRLTGLKNSKIIGYLLLVVLAIFIGYLVSRPLWQVSYNESIPEGIQNYIGSLQEEAGYTREQTRDYAEQTTVWMVWYLGMAVCITAIIGLIYSAYLALIRKKHIYFLPIILLFGASTLYFIRVGITPDHVWAARRFLPYTFPGIFFFTAIALQSIAGIKLKNIHIGVVCSITVLALIFQQTRTLSAPYVSIEEYQTQYPQINELCESLPEDAVAIWIGPKAQNSLMTTRAYCDVSSYRFIDIASQQDLAQIYEELTAKNKVPVLVVSGSDFYDHVPVSARGGMVEVSSSIFEKLPSELYFVPNETEAGSRSFLIGLINGDGTTSVIPINHSL